MYYSIFSFETRKKGSISSPKYVKKMWRLVCLISSQALIAIVKVMEIQIDKARPNQSPAMNNPEIFIP